MSGGHNYLKRQLIYTDFFEASEAAIYSAPVKDRAKVIYFFNKQKPRDIAEIAI